MVFFVLLMLFFVVVMLYFNYQLLQMINDNLLDLQSDLIRFFTSKKKGKK